MSEWLIRFSLAQRAFVLLFAAVLAAAGVMAFFKLPIDAFPDISPTQVKIIMKAPGMTPEEVEARITVPIELEMLGIPHQRTVRSTTKYALADVTIDFEEGTDIYWARAQVAERLTAAAESFPQGTQGGLAPITTPLGEMMMFTLEGNASLEEKRRVLDWVIRPKIRVIPGVADMNSLGGLVRTFEVRPNPQKMAARGVGLQDLAQALEKNNANSGAGRLGVGEEVLLVRSVGTLKNTDDILATVVKVGNGVPIRVSDVADVAIGSLTRYGFVAKDGRGEAVEGLVLGLRGANAREVVAQVRKAFAEIEPSLPEGMKVELFYDRGRLVDKAVGTVSRALIEAAVLVLVLLMLFLQNARAALTVALILPFSALATFWLMKQFGMSANLMSLGGLAIAIGMLVDSAVVVVENMVTHLAHPSPLPRSHRIYRALTEVSQPVVSGIAIIMIVFLPLLTLEGLEGKLFKPVALAIVFALGASLVLSLSVIPVAASFLLTKVKEEEGLLVRFLLRVYEPALKWSLGHARSVVLIVVAVLVIAVIGFMNLGKTFMPTMDEGDMVVGLESLPTISLEASREQSLAVQRALMAAVPEVKGVVGRTGSDELGLDPMGMNQTDSFLVLAPVESWRNPDKEWLQGEIRAVLDEFPGISYSFTQPIEMRISEMLTGARGDVAVKIYGTDMGELSRLAGEVAAALETVEGSVDVYAALNDGVRYLQVELDRQRLSRLGMDVESLQSVLKASLEGEQVGTILEGTMRTPLVIKSPERWQRGEEFFKGLPVTLPDGSSVPLSTVAVISEVEGPVMIAHENARRLVTVQSNVEGRDLVGFVDEAKKIVEEKVNFPEGYDTHWGGEFENQQRAAARLMLVVPVALGLIFLLLFLTFNSMRQAVIVLGNIPFAMVGGIVALWLSGEYLSVPASVGFIALLGVAVLNGVVMVTYFNQLSATGLNALEVVITGAKRRLRPVMMTASIAALGLVPLLFATGPGSEIQKPLAIVVIGGLITSTALTLLILPLIYYRYGQGGTYERVG
ncbi:MAG: efflux RND transporter permease subunit [Campylobacterales bacterium]